MLTWMVAAGVIVLGALVLVLYPTRSYLSQRDAIRASETKLAKLDAENDRLLTRINQLKSNSEVERLARRDLGMVRPGEHAFSMVQAPAFTGVPDRWPFNLVKAIAAEHGVTSPA